jgi:hypothetical protein
MDFRDVLALLALANKNLPEALSHLLNIRFSNSALQHTKLFRDFARAAKSLISTKESFVELENTWLAMKKGAHDPLILTLFFAELKREIEVYSPLSPHAKTPFTVGAAAFCPHLCLLHFVFFSFPFLCLYIYRKELLCRTQKRILAVVKVF